MLGWFVLSAYELIVLLQLGVAGQYCTEVTVWYVGEQLAKKNSFVTVPACSRHYSTSMRVTGKPGA